MCERSNAGRNSAVATIFRLRRFIAGETGRYPLSDLNYMKTSSVLTSLFRLFVAVDPSKGRKLNPRYDPTFNKFTDTLSDSPLIASHKLGKEWRQYNEQLITQVGACNFRCCYCYVDDRLLTGKHTQRVSTLELVGQFLELKESLRVSRGAKVNVLRISGGEPFLAPDLIQGCLEEIERLGLRHEIMVKSETNLSPFFVWRDEVTIKKWIDLEPLTAHSNFSLHPSIHGINPSNFSENTLMDGSYFDHIFKALEILIEYGFDIYPRFPANACPTDALRDFFTKVKAIHPNLPLRFELSIFGLRYAPVRDRLGFSKRAQKEYDAKDVISAWDELLLEEYGVGYAEIPRCEVQLR